MTMRLAESYRQKIDAVKLLLRLQNHALGLIDMTPTEVRAIEILLRKCLPDLLAVDHAGEVTHNHIAILPPPIEDADEWLKLFGPSPHQKAN